MSADLTIDFADESGENLGDQHVMQQLEADKRVLTEVMREKNNLQDANIKMDVEVKTFGASLRTPRRRISGFSAAFSVSVGMNPFKGVRRTN